MLHIVVEKPVNEIYGMREWFLFVLRFILSIHLYLLKLTCVISATLYKILCFLLCKRVNLKIKFKIL